mmetsp:Transcript_3862/g.11123  ORF Transcript_3862/g.11123 Transcript_3862/m.11123 type:complete len:273 (+) Transcript_3862:654-1472(+)
MVKKRDEPLEHDPLDLARLGHFPEFDHQAQAIAEENQGAGLVLEQVKENDNLAGAIYQDAPCRQAFHGFVLAPEADVALEGQHVEHSVQQGDDRGEGQEIRVCLQEHALQLLRLFLVGQAHLLLQFPGFFHLQVYRSLPQGELMKPYAKRQLAAGGLIHFGHLILQEPKVVQEDEGSVRLRLLVLAKEKVDGRLDLLAQWIHGFVTQERNGQVAFPVSRHDRRSRILFDPGLPPLIHLGRGHEVLPRLLLLLLPPLGEWVGQGQLAHDGLAG